MLYTTMRRECYRRLFTDKRVRFASSYRRPNYGGYYTLIMDQRASQGKDGEDEKAGGEGKTKSSGVVFYSRLAGYPEKDPSQEKPKMYAGVVVPPRPEEPLNCCQSGCVHCVWDIYREDIEAYQEKRDAARQALVAAGEAVPAELGGPGPAQDMISLLDPSLQAFVKLEKELRERREGR